MTDNIRVWVVSAVGRLSSPNPESGTEISIQVSYTIQGFISICHIAMQETSFVLVVYVTQAADDTQYDMSRE
jgi:hypothetical protein